MKRALKITGIVVGSLIVLVVLAGLIGWSYIDSNFFSFEEDYAENLNSVELTENGYTFIDRNGNGKLDVYEDDRNPVKARVADLLSQMTVEEKIHILKGSGIASAMGKVEPGEGIPGAVGTIVPTPRLGIPTVYLSDGPAGLRIEPTREGEDRTFYCTAFPIATLLASTWNQELVQQVGNAMGNEALEYGIDVILGPGANIHRHPLCGRNFEYYSEDPFLTGTMGASIVNGIESNGVGTSVKHFVANNQETERDLNDVIISERALREIYLKGFEIVVDKAQPWTIMSSYNKINGTYTSESEYLLTDVLRDDWGFEGLVMTDWFGGRNAAAQISAGNDLLEPGTKKQWKALTEAYEEGQLSEEAIDRSAGRILELVFKTKKMQNHKYGNNPDLEAHAAITRQSASEGMVLLKNENALPIKNVKNVALLGVTSYGFIAGGTGSGDVNEAYTVSLEEGLTNAGFQINDVAKNIFETHKKANEEAFVQPEGIDAMFNPYSPPEITFTEEQLSEIVSTSDVGILTIGRNAGEGGDRVEVNDFLLTALEQELIANTSKAFQNANKKLIVVLNIGGVIETASWKEHPDAILLAWQGGQEGGNSVADILSGMENPSGKLPMTFPVNLDDHASNVNFPQEGGHLSFSDLASTLLFPKEERPDAEKMKNRDFTNYEEGIYVGYRHFDKSNMPVSFAFGFGLSYTDFEYSDMELTTENDTVNVSLTIKNIGDLAGKEVVQVYSEKMNSNIDRPVQELRAFTKTNNLDPGASEMISIQIPVSDLRYWDEDNNKWTLEKGAYRFRVGSSSRDIKLTGEAEL
ncbi:glycoside hydrolase family 3 N-terminal domain-containing protein [Flagellimonas nanhaiensis]|uniref:Beta-glucosidase n=1 Tax=Flagellimonas nanhaiensis TaxID=2292706 RepID=A0A371JT02_9FLAO|nr:glycoside hydrolase family 3 N-terminal domain-containing protein [Allomuricauda nanhaiensis]RDY60935.1 beta-glucosidase [Allomuricauda nanhaiensis]